MTIQPYNRDNWNVLIQAFRHFITARRDYSRQHRELADNQLKKRLDAIAHNTKQHRALNPHIIGNGAYTKTGIYLLDGKPRPARPAINLDTHSNGMQINWGYSGKPGYRVPIKLIVPEQPEHIRLQLKIMEAAA